MSELEQKAKKELIDRLTVHELANLTSGRVQICVVDKTLHRDVLTKRLKSGWILKEDFDENYDTIVKWERERDFINDTRREIRDLEEDVVDMREQITDVESGKWKALRPRLPKFREILKSDLETLVTKRQKLEEAKIEFKPLRASIKSLKEKFKLYISQLEVVE